MELRFVPDDKAFYYFKENQIVRGPFYDEAYAKKSLETYAKTGKWPEGKKNNTTEQDV